MTIIDIISWINQTQNAILYSTDEKEGSIKAAILSRMFELTLWGEFNDQQKDNV